ncbi:MAG TPA: MFS transporter [Candidatus Poseidoniales archaeon]|nr:MAG TPA: MFS transporter [Candidatus Poseidoniales archaeon]|tara:strand:+ start:1580 stop:2911 length:1332 start_codon:yes stop_codon:yes gene_type:complete
MDEGNKKAVRGQLLILFLVTFIDMIGFGIVIPFLTYLVDDLATEGGIEAVGLWVGLVMTAYPMAQFLSAPLWGGLSDRIGRRPILMIGLVGNTFCFALFGLAPTLFIAIAARFLAGFFNGNIAVARAYIGDISRPEQMASRMGLIGASFGLGFTFGPFIGGELSAPAERWEIFQGTLLETYPYLLPCLVASALSIVSLLLARTRLPESLPSQERQGASGLDWLGTMRSSFSGLFSSLRAPAIGQLLWVTMFYSFGFTIMHAVFILFTEMSPADGGLGFTEAQNGRIFAVIGLTGIVVQGGLIRPLSKRFSSRSMLPIAVVITGIGLGAIPYASVEYAWLWLLPTCIVIASGSGIFQPTSSSLLASYAQRNGRELGSVMGAMESASAFARILGPFTGGLVWTLTVSETGWFSYHTVFQLCAVIMLVTFFMALRLPSDSEATSSF